MYKWTVASCLILLAAQVWAVTYEWPLQEVPKLSIVTSQAQITVKEKPLPTLKITVSDAGEELVLERSEHTVFLRPNSTDKIDFAQVKGSRKIIEIEGPSLPLQLQLMEGSLEVTSWKKDIFAHIHRGRVQLNAVSADSFIQLLKGDIVVNNHNGSLRTDSYQGNLQIRNFSGELDLYNFVGDLLVDRLKGSAKLNSHQGNAKFVSVTGNLDFEMGKGSLSVSRFQGRLEGNSNEGSQTISLSKASDLHLRSQTGRISVNTAPGTASWLNAASSGGEIYLPQQLKASRTANGRSFRGRLQGGESKGSISIRSADGTIVVR